MAAIDRSKLEIIKVNGVKKAKIICECCKQYGLVFVSNLYKKGKGRFCSKACSYKSLPKKNPVERFLKFVSKDNNGCWIWNGAKDKFGYGQFQIGRQIGCVQAHRFSYKNFVSEIPKGKLVCHSCDIPSCVNPAHLWIGTHKDNTDDMIKKNRQRLNTKQKYFTQEEKKIARREINKRYELKKKRNTYGKHNFA